MVKSIYSANYYFMINLLIENRKSIGLTQTELAKLLDKPQSYISKYESKERRIDLCEFLTIVKAINNKDALSLISTLLDNWVLE